MGNPEVLRIPLDIQGVESEEVDVEKLGGGHYLVRSIPAVSRDCALGDVVVAEAVDEVLEFQALAIAGGNSTLRLLVEATALTHVRAQLETLGLQVEHPLSEMLAVNIALDSPAQGLDILLESLVVQGIVQIAPGDVSPPD